VPLPQGFKIQVQYAEDMRYLPQILTQYSSPGPAAECQRFIHVDRQEKVVSTVLWFAPHLKEHGDIHPGSDPKAPAQGLLYYSVELGNELSDEFAYAINDLLKDIR